MVSSQIKQHYRLGLLFLGLGKISGCGPQRGDIIHDRAVKNEGILSLRSDSPHLSNSLSLSLAGSITMAEELPTGKSDLW